MITIRKDKTKIGKMTLFKGQQENRKITKAKLIDPHQSVSLIFRLFIQFCRLQQMFIQPNCFQRQTQILGEPQVRSEILFLYQISHLIANYQYQDGLKNLNKYLQSNEIEDEGLYYQFQFMLAFCTFQLKDVSKTAEICQQLYKDLEEDEKSILEKSALNASNRSLSKSALYQDLMRSFSVRFYTFVIGVCSRGINIGVDHIKTLDKLIRILKIDKCVYLPEVLGTLTGCRNFKAVKEMKYLEGEENHRKAIKLQVLSNWKYFVRQRNDCIQFKKQALAIWREQNCLKEKEKCQMQLKELLENQSSSKLKGKFIIKLERLNYFLKKLIELEPQVHQKSEKLNIKWAFPMIIASFQCHDEQKKSSDKGSLTQSKLVRVNDKKMQMNNILNCAQEFYSVLKKEKHSEITSLIKNSKFLDESIREIRKKLVIISKLRRHAFFYYSFPFIKDCAIARHKKANKK